MLFKSVAVIAFLGSVAASPSMGGSRQSFLVPLSGHDEAGLENGHGLKGDLDASGQVALTVDVASRRICYEFEVTGLSTPLMAHIHKAPRERDGPSVVTLFTGPGAPLDDCIPWTEKWLSEIVARPADFYVNVYTTEYPDGALRGQLAS